MSRRGIRRTVPVALFTACATTVGYLGYRGLLSGVITVDLGIGRRTQALGPQTIDVDAPRDTAFDMIAGPYLQRTSEEGDGMKVLTACDTMVLAAHRMKLPDGRVARTVETVRFTRPERVDFRLVRGPVPFMTETYEFTARDGGTRVTYTGEIGTDLWGLGRIWGRLAAQRLEAVVADFLETVKSEAESHAAAAGS